MQGPAGDFVFREVAWPQFIGFISKIIKISSAEPRAKISAAHKCNKYNVGKPLSPERRAKIAASLTGKTASIETRRKQSAARKGKRMPEGFGVGKVHSDETKRKMSEAAKKRWESIAPDSELRRRMALNFSRTRATDSNDFNFNQD